MFVMYNLPFRSDRNRAVKKRGKHTLSTTGARIFWARKLTSDSKQVPPGSGVQKPATVSRWLLSTIFSSVEDAERHGYVVQIDRKPVIGNDPPSGRRGGEPRQQTANSSDPE